MYSDTYGKVTKDQMIQLIKEYIEKDKNSQYKIAIGTDSQNHDLTKVVVVIAIHRKGKGGIFFYDIQEIKKISNIRQKIYYETSISLEFASDIVEAFVDHDIQQEIEIHVDIGENGKTNELISEITGWVKASGYKCRIKPYSPAASCIANKISK